MQESIEKLKKWGKENGYSDEFDCYFYMLNLTKEDVMYSIDNNLHPNDVDRWITLNKIFGYIPYSEASKVIKIYYENDIDVLDFNEI